jgi:hypothetical protein
MTTQMDLTARERKGYRTPLSRGTWTVKTWISPLSISYQFLDVCASDLLHFTRSLRQLALAGWRVTDQLMRDVLMLIYSGSWASNKLRLWNHFSHQKWSYQCLGINELIFDIRERGFWKSDNLQIQRVYVWWVHSVSGLAWKSRCKYLLSS